MSDDRLSNLQRALTTPLGAHVDDALLATIVTAELAGEDVDSAYAPTMLHIELCETCLQAYAELSELMNESLAAMSAAAAAVPPEQVYASLLMHRLREAGLTDETTRQSVEQIAAALPLVILRPLQRQEVDESLLAAALQAAGSNTEQETGEKPLSTALLQALRETVSSLNLYLRGKASAIWGRQTSAQIALAEGWNRLQLSLLPPPVQPTLHDDAADEQHWDLVHRTLGQPLPVTVRARAERLTPFTCRIVVRADRPGQRDPSGRTIRLLLAGVERGAATNEAGEAYFEPVPIAALSTFTIDVAGG